MLSSDALEKILFGIEYKDWRTDFTYHVLSDSFELELSFMRHDSETGEFGPCQNMRPWIIEAWRSESYVIGTIYAMIKMAEDHETAENFKYHGEAIFSHHNLERQIG